MKGETKFNPKDVLKTFELLDHKKQTEIRLIEANKDNGKCVSEFVNETYTNFVQKCKKNNGTKWNVYVGINERKDKGTKDVDVTTLNIYAVDIDPVRPKNISSTDEQLQQTKEVTDEIIDYFVSLGLNKPSIAMSGNGYQLWCKLKPVSITEGNRKEITEKIKAFQTEIQNKFKTSNVNIDSIHNLSRILKVIGTVSLKGDLHRLSYWVEYHNEIDEKLTKHILNIPIDNKTTFENVKPTNEKDKDNSRSAKEFRELIKLIANGKTKEEVFNEMNMYSKWSAAPPQYKELSYTKALNYVNCKKPKHDNSNFILDDSKLPQLLDHAMGVIEIEGKKYRYYGAWLFEKTKKKTKEGKDFIIDEKTPVLICENGILISKNTKPKNCTFDLLTVMTMRENRWSLNSIKSFTNGTEETSFKKVHEAFKKVYDESMVFEEPEWYDVHAIYDHLSYYWDVLDKVALLKHEGVSGSAKSKSMKISANLGFNGKKFLNPSCASFFRYRHHNKSLICVEEAEKLFDNSKLNTSDSDMVEILNGSYERGNNIPRQNQNDISKTDEFDPFGLTRIGSIKPIKGALAKRNMTTQHVKAPGSDKRGNVEIDSPNKKKFYEVRNLAYINGLQNHLIFVKNLECVENTFGLKNREWLVAKPFLAMAKCIDCELENKLGLFIAKQFEQRDDDYDESSWEYQLAGIMIEIFASNENVLFVSTNHIKKEFEKIISKEFTTHAITKMLNGLGLSKFKARSKDHTKRGWQCDFYEVVEVLLRNQIINIFEVLKKVSKVSNCPHTENKINKWYKDTLMDTLDKGVSISGHLDGQDTFSGGSVGKMQKELIEKNVKEEVKEKKELTLEEQIIDHIRSNPKCSTDDIISFNEGTKEYLEIVIKRLKTAGHIFENKPDQWMVLE